MLYILLFYIFYIIRACFLKQTSKILQKTNNFIPINFYSFIH